MKPIASASALLPLVALGLVVLPSACSNDAEPTSATSGTQPSERDRDAPASARDSGTLTNTPAPPPTSAPAPHDAGLGNSNGCTLKFHDEFDSFDPNVWNDHIWYEASNSTKNYAVEDGKLKIWPQRDATGKFFNRTIDTDGKYYQTYGYFEISAKLTRGKGTWPAFWLFNHIGDARPEIDVMEAYPGGGPSSGWGDANLHPVAFAATGCPNGAASANAGSKTLQTSDLSAAFHRYGVLWTPNKQTYYFDGKEFWSLDVSMGDAMYILLDVWFGSASGTPDDSTPQGKDNAFEIDWVRAWDCPGTSIPTP